ncbi:MAG: hypothetical protein ABSH38_09680 [Verrucomicrobiota bacterium]|jgi:hypothetical protein
MTHSRKLLSLALTSVFAAVASQAQNLVQNPGFETGNTTDWTLTPAASGSGFQILTEIPAQYGGQFPHSGNYLAGFGANEGLNDTLSQTVPTVNGVTYDFNFWVNSVEGKNGSYLDVSWGNSTVLQIDPAIGDFGWTDYNFVETATGPTTIAFAGRNAPSYIALDDVSVTAATVPDAGPGMATVTATLFGLCGLGRFLRRRAA